MLPVVGFKLGLAPANDLMGPTLVPRLAQLSDPARHGAILAAAGRDLRQFGEWTVLPYFAMALGMLGWRRAQPVPWMVPRVIVLMAAGYYGIYLLSPHDLAWHLDTSLVRLLLQLWPLVILGWALSLPVEVTATGGGSWFRGPVWAWPAANGLVAAGVLFALSGQPAAGEFAAHRRGFDTVSLSLGDGWYAPERTGSQRWAWSRGDADVAIYADASGALGPVTLRFALRSFGPRILTLRSGERILWTAPVGDRAISVVVPDLHLPPGVTVLRFTSDAPPQPESAAAGARLIAYAIFNPELQ